MNVDDPKLTAYALDELDESERSAIARATADSPEVQRFVAETQDLARALRSQYRLELQRELVAPGKLTAIHGDTFWSKAGPLAIAALIAVLAVVGAVMFSSNESRISAPTGSSLSRDLARDARNRINLLQSRQRTLHGLAKMKSSRLTLVHTLLLASGRLCQ